MKCSLIVPCLRHRDRHHCRDPDPSRTIGRTSVVFLNLLALNDSGELTNMVRSLSPGRLLVYGLMIEAAIMVSPTLRRLEYQVVPSSARQRKHPSERTSSKTKHQRSFERPLALVMIAQPLALLGSCDFNCSSSRSDLMRFDVLASLP